MRRSTMSTIFGSDGKAPVQRDISSGVHRFRQLMVGQAVIIATFMLKEIYEQPAK